VILGSVILGSVILRGLLLESLPAALTVKGAGGEKQPGRTPTVVLRLSGIEVVRVVAVPQGRAGVVRIVDPGPAAQQLNDPPSSINQAQGMARGADRNKKFLAPTAPHANSQQPQPNSQG